MRILFWKVVRFIADKALVPVVAAEDALLAVYGYADEMIFMADVAGTVFASWVDEDEIGDDE